MLHHNGYSSCLTFSAGNVVSGIVLILIGVLIPLIISVALYPVFALSLIESNTAETNDNLARIIELLENKSTSAPSEQTAHEPEEIIPPEVDEYLNDELAKFKKGKNQVGL